MCDFLGVYVKRNPGCLGKNNMCVIWTLYKVISTSSELVLGVRDRDQEWELCDRVLEEKDVLYLLSLQGT